MSAHPYKAAMLDQLAAQADGIIELRREREAELQQEFTEAFYLRWERAEHVHASRARRPWHVRAWARIRGWWKRPRRHGFAKSGAEL